MTAVLLSPADNRGWGARAMRGSGVYLVGGASAPSDVYTEHVRGYWRRKRSKKAVATTTVTPVVGAVGPLWTGSRKKIPKTPVGVVGPLWQGTRKRGTRVLGPLGPSWQPWGRKIKKARAPVIPMDITPVVDAAGPVVVSVPPRKRRRVA
ncbi:pVII [Frog adenovirus 1]|uniref:PVII n=1 Tax=Frog adenovirus 1 (strain ATCC VR-896) TaxID=114102 RepID=Q9IIH8_ADEF1|nr:pVII [Frog adenovirus 1]AAF86929.1 pVII [Frog adenovirus 1]